MNIDISWIKVFDWKRDIIEMSGFSMRIVLNLYNFYNVTSLLTISWKLLKFYKI
jgi:hypothetical protein